MSVGYAQVLFLCTGNYYRSRFAEYIFNHYAPEYNLAWRAFSRGLAIELLEKDAGPLSPHTREGLTARNIAFADQLRSPIALTEQDLLSAQHIIALKQSEHRLLMSRKFPDWVDRVDYWHVHDIDMAAPADALPEIETAVRELLALLAAKEITPGCGRL